MKSEVRRRQEVSGLEGVQDKLPPNSNPQPRQDLLQYGSSLLCLMLIYDLAI